MKPKHLLLPLLIMAISIFISCGSNNKKDESPTENPTKDTTVAIPGTAAGPVKIDSGARNPGPGDEKDKILSNIDQHLISKPDIGKAILTVENTLKDATIIKAYVEVS